MRWWRCALNPFAAGSRFFRVVAAEGAILSARGAALGLVDKDHRRQWILFVDICTAVRFFAANKLTIFVGNESA